MSVSPAIICSNALSLLQEDSILTLLDETVRARRCNQHFDVTRDAMLESHPWNFATHRVQLVAIDTPAPAFNFSYTFQLPSDYLKVQEVYPDYIEYAIESDRILADSSEVYIAYTRKLTDYNKYNPLFIYALQYQLASVMAPMFKHDYKIAQMYAAEADRWLSKAKSSDAQASRSKLVKSDDLIDARKVL